MAKKKLFELVWFWGEMSNRTETYAKDLISSFEYSLSLSGEVHIALPPTPIFGGFYSSSPMQGE
ncbi:MAG TPA: hypothetical protein VK211_23545 [Kamptonema sp.]|nr:hypothetical protein [Kamptonema sp.]